ncbi:MAG: hypothetical protein JNL81_01495 [Hyphomonadaceae bacterium]|nr:hypothetical protein [Hyphomonadaceae bacterium]
MAREREPQKASKKARKVSAVRRTTQQPKRAEAGKKLEQEFTTEDGQPLFRVINLTLLSEELKAWDLKYERRVAPEFRLRCSAAVLECFVGLTAEVVELVMDLARARVHAAETQLCGLETLYVVGRLPVTIQDLNSWWLSFNVGELWFKIEVCDERVRKNELIRDYEIVVADGPSPPETPKPTLQRLQKNDPPKRIGPRPRARKNRADSKAVRGTKIRAPQRKTPNASREGGKRRKSAKRAAMAMFKRSVRKIDVFRDNVDFNLRELTRIAPIVLRQCVTRLRQIGGSVLRAMCDVRVEIVQLAHQSTAFVVFRRLALTSSCANVGGAFGSEARLESRMVGQNTGLSLVLSSWIWAEPSSIDRNQSSSGIDWSLDIFGVPEEKQAFT